MLRKKLEEFFQEQGKKFEEDDFYVTGIRRFQLLYFVLSAFPSTYFQLKYFRKMKDHDYMTICLRLHVVRKGEISVVRGECLKKRNIRFWKDMFRVVSLIPRSKKVEIEMRKNNKSFIESIIDEYHEILASNEKLISNEFARKMEESGDIDILDDRIEEKCESLKKDINQAKIRVARVKKALEKKECGENSFSDTGFYHHLDKLSKSLEKLTFLVLRFNNIFDSKFSPLVVEVEVDDSEEFSILVKEIGEGLSRVKRLGNVLTEVKKKYCSITQEPK